MQSSNWKKKNGKNMSREKNECFVLEKKKIYFNIAWK